MSVLELAFPVLGPTIPSDHGYALYGAIARVVPAIHEPESPVRIGPIRGIYAGQGVLNLDQRFSSLRLRLPAERISMALPLAGQSLEIAGHRVRLGVPNVAALLPATALVARLVTIKASSPRKQDAIEESRDPVQTKRYLDPLQFLQAVQRDLAKRGIAGEALLPHHADGPHADQPRRRVLRIHGRSVIGFTVLVQGLSATESIQLQEEGVGGRRKLGCGFFIPIVPRRG